MTINNEDDFLEALQSNPQWRAAVRLQILGEELMQFPGQVAQFVEATNANFQLVHRRLERIEDDITGLKSNVAGLKDGQKRLEAGMTDLRTSMNNLQGTMGNMTGSKYQRMAETIAHRRLRSGLDILDAETILSGSIPPHESPVRKLIDDGIANGTVSLEEAERVEVELADLVLRGRTPDGEDVYAVVEVSVTVHEEDITRARERARTLAQATGRKARAVVIGEEMPEKHAALAEELDVAFLPLPYRQPSLRSPEGGTPEQEAG